MLRKMLLDLKARHLQALREQKGQSIIIFTFAVIGLIAMLGLALDLGLVYIEKVKVNRAADATALAAVVELPYEQDTINRAVEYIRLNGYDVGVDTEILVRGCIVSPTTYVDSQNVTHVYNLPGTGPKTYWEGTPTTSALTATTLITGAKYISATQSPVRATFVIDTGSYQGSGTANCSSSVLGTATKVRVSGRVNVPMNFMQFFGFSKVPVQDEAIAENLSSLDIVIVFDVSGSMEDQTICHDCWVRTAYGSDWPNNGYFNPLPYNPNWATAGTDNQSIPLSGLCLQPTAPFITNTYKYLTLEAELYSRNVGNWGLDVRTPGQGFWALQRASKGSAGMSAEDSDQKSQAGSPGSQSSNVCRPNVIGGPSTGIDCTVGGAGNLGDNVCSSSDSANGPIAVDCSAYIAARPMATYGQVPGYIPNLSGAAYNADCFTNAGGVGSLSGNCWSSSPWYSILGPGPSQVPWVEYDFTPVWTQTTTYIWIRAIGGGEEGYTWAGSSPDQLQPDPDNNTSNNITPWRKVIYWQVNNGTINQRKDNLNNDDSNSPSEGSSTNNTYYFQRGATWLVNRADNSQWRWIKLGSTATVSGTQYTLKLYQGSAGYMVDKIILTNDPNGTTNEGATSASNLPAALRRKADGTIATATDYPNQLGPPASFGSATREACNKCNPAYGYQVDPNECTCRKNSGETGYGTGQGCTVVLTSTNTLQDQLETGLYSGLQPLRSAQEAVKNFARKLDPKFDQLGIVGFTSDDSSPNGDNYRVQNDTSRRSKLQCLTWAAQKYGNAARCYDPSQGTPITYTNVLSAVEKQWPMGGTNIASGIKEGLEELGISGFATDSTCITTAVNDGHACDRQGAARRIIILMTDGSPNANPGSCAPGSGRPDLWNGLLGTDDDDFECAAYYASLAAANNVTLYTIGIGAGANQDFLTALATGVDPHGDETDIPLFNGASGKYFPAAKPTDLEIIFDAILSNIYVRIVS